MKSVNHCFKNYRPYQNQLRYPNMTQNLRVCTIFCRLEVVYDVISGQNVRTIEGYAVVNFEVASSDSFRDI